MSTKNPAARAAWTLLVKACFLALLWAGWGQGEEGPRNVATFLIYFSALVSFLMLFCESCQRRSRDEGLPLPLWLYGAFGIAIVIVLAWYGEWWLGALQVFSLTVTVAIDTGETKSKVPL